MSALVARWQGCESSVGGCLRSTDRVLGGILLPDTAKNKPQRGTVLAVGPGRLKPDGSRAEPQLKVGDKVLFTAWAGDEFKDKGSNDDLVLMREGDVLCVLT